MTGTLKPWTSLPTMDWTWRKGHDPALGRGQRRLTLPGIGEGNDRWLAEGNLHCLAFSPDGKILAAGGMATSRNFVLWDAHTGIELATPEGHIAHVDSIVFSPDARIVCTAGYDGTIKLWNSGTWNELESRFERRHVSRVNSVAFSPDGKLLVSRSGDGTIRLWPAATQKELTEAGW